MATIPPVKDFNPEEDCRGLRSIFQDLETKGAQNVASRQMLIDIFTNRSRKQRDVIEDSYMSMYGTPLEKEIKSNLNGHFKEGLLALVLPPAVVDAERLYRAMKGLGTDEHKLREIICSRDSKELKEIADAYVKTYKRELVQDIKGDVSGQFCRILCNLVQGSRGDGSVDRARSRQTAMNLQSGMSNFIDVFTTESFSHLNAVFSAFRKQSGESIFTALKSVHSGEVFKTLCYIAMCAICIPEFFAIMLINHFTEPSAAKGALIDIILRRCDIDLYDIKQVYKYRTGTALRDVVAREVKGEFRDLLLLAMK